MRHDPQALRERIAAALPVGLVVPEHDERGHWYRVFDDPNPLKGVRYPSVTGKLQMLKDEGLANWKMNMALQYVFAHHTKFTEANIMEHIDRAERVSVDIFHDAGDVGTLIHNIREAIFREWMRAGVRPQSFESFITQDIKDIRAVSAIAALEKFVDDYSYIPVACELMVYSHKWQVAGMLDDLGLMRLPIRKGDPACDHANPFRHNNTERCIKCDGKWKWVLALVDLKTSNRFKPHYLFQVAMYWKMFHNLTGLRPEHAFILKVSKEDRTYQLQELKKPAKLAQYANHLIKVNEGLEFIKSIQKDNQRKVITI